MSDTELFGFMVRRHEDGWTVALPHQCDDWNITYGARYKEPIPHETAVRHLNEFIAEAQTALAALERREEFGADW